MAINATADATGLVGVVLGILPGNADALRELRRRLDEHAATTRSPEVDPGRPVIVRGELNSSPGGSDGASRGEQTALERLAEEIVGLPRRGGSILKSLEAAVLRHALRAAAGNKSKAARLLGMERMAYERRLARVEDEGE